MIKKLALFAILVLVVSFTIPSVDAASVNFSADSSIITDSLSTVVESPQPTQIEESIIETPQPTQIEEPNPDEGLSESDLIRKYCFRGNDGIMYDKRERTELCPYNTTSDSENFQIIIILIVVGISALIIARYVIITKRKSPSNVKKALKIIDDLLQVEILDPRQLESIKEKLENKTPLTEDEVAYLQEKMKQL